MIRTACQINSVKCTLRESNHLCLSKHFAFGRSLHVLLINNVVQRSQSKTRNVNAQLILICARSWELAGFSTVELLLKGSLRLTKLKRFVSSSRS